jgi:transposase
MNEKRERRSFSDEFKHQIVQLYNAGKPKSAICREYELVPAVVDRWIKRINTSGSAKECDNRTPEELELIKLQKEIKQLKMENDILKQAALIFAQK